MREKIEKFKNNGFLQLLKKGLASKYFPFFTAAVTLLCYYLGWDLVLIYYISIVGILILLLLDDITPFISVMLFLSIMISYKNSPSDIMGDSDYYFRTANLIQIFIILSIYILTVLYRIGLTVIRKKFRLTPAFWGMCGFAAILLLNGLFSENYSAKNLLYGLIMAASFLGVFCVLKDNIKLDSDGYEKIAFAFLAFSIVLVIEVLVKYININNIIINDSINRNELTFGWGIWNTMGMWLTMCIPAVIYLAYKKQYGFVFTLYSLLICASIFLSSSRQAMIFGVFIYSICIIILLVKAKNKLPNIIIISAVAIAATIMIIYYRESIFIIIKDIFKNFIVNGKIDGSGRTTLWRQGIENYRSAPLLGVGFYSELYTSINFSGFSGLGFMPDMCHNTIIQILSSCGTLGIIVYLLHRIQTIICYCKNITTERTYIALIIFSLLIISLVDNHIFNIFPTIVYSCLVAVITNDTERKNNKIKTPL